MFQAACAQKMTADLESSLFPAGFYRPYELAAQAVFLLCSALRDEAVACGSDPGVRMLTYRLKTPASISGKLRARGLPVTPLSAASALHDVAGVRVVLEDVDQVYRFAAMLSNAPEIQVCSVRDYILHPKKSGYRSLHQILLVPAHAGVKTPPIPVEVQLRTAGMDIWASMEHDSIYKPSPSSH